MPIRNRQAIFYSISQGKPTRLNDVRGRADRAPTARSVLHIDEHSRRRRRARVAVENVHLVVGQIEIRQMWIDGDQSLTQRGVQRVDRPVALSGGMENLTACRTFIVASANSPRPSRCSTTTIKSIIWNGGVYPARER